MACPVLSMCVCVYMCASAFAHGEKKHLNFGMNTTEFPGLTEESCSEHDFMSWLQEHATGGEKNYLELSRALEWIS